MRIAPLAPLDPDLSRPSNWAADKPLVLAYLRSGLGVAAARTLLPDEIDPEHPLSVEVVLFTDGEWVWSAQHIYYAEHHDIPIDPDLVEYARGRGFEVGEVPDSAIDEAMDALDEADDDSADSESPAGADDSQPIPAADTLTPYEWCQRYARGGVSREQLITILGDYRYTPAISDREWNDVIEQPPGTVRELERAATNGLIDPDTYEAILDRRDRPRS